MPKQIENICQQLLAEARRQVAERGYSKTTVRSVAGACGIAAGTVYNYFPSKESLIASFVAEDWCRSLAAIRAKSRGSPKDCLRAVYDELVTFAESHRDLFADPDAAKAASAAFLPRHLQLREQLAGLIEPVAPSADGFTARFTAEALLTWTISSVPFERIYQELKKLIINEKEESYEQL